VSKCNLIDDEFFKAWVTAEVESISGVSPISFYEDEVIPVIHAIRPVRVCGVYYLYLGDELQYIGRSVNVYSRLNAHMQNSPFEFDSFQLQEFSHSDSVSREADAINVHKPKWNRMIPNYSDRENL